MKYNILIIVTIFSLLFIISCNDKKYHGKIVYKIVEINEFANEKYKENLKINISGYYGNWGRSFYEYEISLNGSYNITINETIGGNKNELYNRVLSDNEIENIYEFIKNFDLNKEIELDKHMWVGSHSFVGTLIINIDDIIYSKKIFAGQDINSDIYNILNYLNTFTPKEMALPITGIYNN